MGQGGSGLIIIMEVAEVKSEWCAWPLLQGDLNSYCTLDASIYIYFSFLNRLTFDLMT